MKYSLKQICAGIHRNVIVPMPVIGANGYHTVRHDIVFSNAEYPAHRLYALHSGKIIANTETRRCILEPGGFLWLSSGYRVNTTIYKGTRVSELAFSLRQNGTPVPLELPFAWFSHGGDVFELLVHAARDRWVQNDATSRVRLKAYVILLLGNMERLIHDQKSTSFTEWQRMMISDLIARRIHERLSIKDIAERLSLSRDYCSRLFKSSFHISPRRFILEERMKEITRELQTSNDTVDTIARRYGYRSVHSFQRLFKQVLGVSPASVRRSR